MTSKYYVGKQLNTNNYGRIEIIDYLKNDKRRIRFLDTGTEIVTSTGSLYRGDIKDRNKPTVYGIGVVGYGEYSSKNKICYETWKSMIERCFCPLYHRRFPTYKNTRLCNSWRELQKFGPWFDKNYIDGYELDKDLLSGSIKVYSSETCVFLPKVINTFLSRLNSYGVSAINGSAKFKVRCHEFLGKSVYLGCYDFDEARLVYDRFKTEQINKCMSYMLDLGHWEMNVIKSLNKFKRKERVCSVE